MSALNVRLINMYTALLFSVLLVVSAVRGLAARSPASSRSLLQAQDKQLTCVWHGNQEFGHCDMNLAYISQISIRPTTELGRQLAQSVLDDVACSNHTTRAACAAANASHACEFLPAGQGVCIASRAKDAIAWTHHCDEYPTAANCPMDACEWRADTDYCHESASFVYNKVGGDAFGVALKRAYDTCHSLTNQSVCSGHGEFVVNVGMLETHARTSNYAFGLIGVGASTMLAAGCLALLLQLQ